MTSEGSWVILIIKTNVARTSEGSWVMWEGMSLPVRNWAVSLEKLLQLCSNNLYVEPV